VSISTPDLSNEEWGTPQINNFESSTNAWQRNASILTILSDREEAVSQSDVAEQIHEIPSDTIFAC
jgi:hypothetical protein